MAGSPSPTLYYAPTRDGWRIALYHYAQTNPRPGRSPVVLCHGLGANRYNVDAPGRYSLARAIWSAGYDAWVVELRGAGKSHRKSRLPGRRAVTYDWNFDDYVHHDVPAVLSTIRERSGTSDVHWIGHSMGGMVGYAFLTMADQHHLRSLVAIGSPSFSGVSSPYIDAALHLRGLLRVLDRVPYRRSVRLTSPLVALAMRQFDFFANPANMDPWLTHRLLRLAVTDVSTGLLRQFMDWYTSQDFRGWYGTQSYKSNLRDIRVPVYILAGTIDRLTPQHDLEYIYAQLSSVDKRLTVVGVEHGFSADYGHVDLVLGRRAPDEVFPLIVDWLNRH